MQYTLLYRDSVTASAIVDLGGLDTCGKLSIDVRAFTYAYV